MIAHACYALRPVWENALQNATYLGRCISLILSGDQEEKKRGSWRRLIVARRTYVRTCVSTNEQPARYHLFIIYNSYNQGVFLSTSVSSVSSLALTVWLEDRREYACKVFDESQTHSICRPAACRPSKESGRVNGGGGLIARVLACVHTAHASSEGERYMWQGTVTDHYSRGIFT